MTDFYIIYIYIYMCVYVYFGILFTCTAIIVAIRFSFFNTATSYPLVPSMFYRRNNEVGFRDRVVDVDDDD